MRTILAVVILFLLVFFIMLLVATHCDPRLPGPQVVPYALEWTRQLLGGIAATAAALGMLGVAASHGSFKRQVSLTVPLLGGLLLISANWALALALGLLCSLWMFRWGGPNLETPDAPSPTSKP